MRKCFFSLVIVFGVIVFGLLLGSPAQATKLVTYSSGGGGGDEARAGAVEGNYVIDLNRGYAFYLSDSGAGSPEAGDSLVPPDLLRILQGGDAALEAVRQCLEYIRPMLANPGGVRQLRASGALHDAGSVKLLTPLPNPHRILAIGLNYREHIEEVGREMPNALTVFAKASMPIGPGDPIRIPKIVKQPDYEVELAFVIGKPASNVSKEDALDYVAGYMTFNDVTARAIQDRTSQWVLGKSVDTFAAAGPYLVLKDEIPDPQNLELKTYIDDELLQNSNTADMLFTVADIIADITQFLTLQPGTIIATGTPSGVGSGRTPPRWLRPGDTIRVEVQGLGVLENPVEQGD
ncbi:MAG: fumarylacetoacetate hydrolase family protein [Acidobacteria bacterium]|nr:fumarylacetoacetate hydrolase family protein [Acidobacteriota bacterium]